MANNALTPSFLQLAPAAPQVGAFLPMMMMMGRRGRRGGNSAPPYDPYQCTATCAAQQGYCPAVASLLQLDEGSFLQLEASPAAPPRRGRAA